MLTPHLLLPAPQVCKFKAHKRCAVRATNNCKWTTLASIGSEIIEDEDGVSIPAAGPPSPGVPRPHPWLLGAWSGGPGVTVVPARRWPCPTSGWRGTCP